MTTNNENIIGLFTEPAQADAAIMDLETHGFTPYHIRSSDKRPMHSFLTHIKKIFTGNASTSTIETNADTQDIEELDIRHEDVLFYEHEMADGHVIVAVNSSDNLLAAINILQAHDAMTNYPITLYSSSHNEDTETPHIPTTNTGTIEQASLNTSSSNKKLAATTHATNPENNTYKSFIDSGPNKLPLVQKTEKLAIHAHPKRMRSRSR